mmetsp:Transcript_2942/g.4920  ORF Transcript_2942/g.4920 Transcript_2942/m.4920 type:complete len:91 (-) Transcript_2942:78-350(-)
MGGRSSGSRSGSAMLHLYKTDGSNLQTLHDALCHEKKKLKLSWTTSEDEILRSKVAEFEGRNWPHIAEYLPGRNAGQCRQRWRYMIQQSK